jgi:hypothetical protein
MCRDNTVPVTEICDNFVIFLYTPYVVRVITFAGRSPRYWRNPTHLIPGDGQGWLWPGDVCFQLPVWLPHIAPWGQLSWILGLAACQKWNCSFVIPFSVSSLCIQVLCAFYQLYVYVSSCNIQLYFQVALHTTLSVQLIFIVICKC